MYSKSILPQTFDWEALQKNFDFRSQPSLEGRTYFFPNDRNFFSALRRLPKVVETVEEKQGNRLMLVVGDSYLLSALPLLMEKSGATILLHCDNDPTLLKYVSYYRQALLSSHNEEEFLEKLTTRDNPAVVDEKDKEGILAAYQLKKKELKEDHCFASEENFKRCKEAHQKITYVPLLIDLFEQKQVNRLASMLPGIICLLNLTNLRQWDIDDQLASTLKILPLVSRPIFLSSCRRETYGYGFDHPKTRALCCSVEEYNQSYIEYLLLSLFWRPACRDNESFCKRIIKGENLVNTKDTAGLLPIEVAAFHDVSPRKVALLLKYGAYIIPSLMQSLEQQIQQFYQSTYKSGISGISDAAAQIEKILTTAAQTQAEKVKPHTKQQFDRGCYFAEIGENARVFTEGDTVVKVLKAGASIIVSKGSLTVSVAEEDSYLETRDESTPRKITLESIQGKKVRLISCGDIVISSATDAAVAAIAAGAMSTQDLGKDSFLVAKKGITAGKVEFLSILLAVEGDIHVAYAPYMVYLATVNANLVIDGDPPHGGTLSIEGDGEIHIRKQSLQASGGSVIYNTRGKVFDHDYFRDRNEFYEQKTHFDTAIHRNLIVQLAFQWYTSLKSRPLYSGMDDSSALKAEDFYKTILAIFNYTPYSFKKDFREIKIGLKDTGFKEVDDFLELIFASAYKSYIESKKEPPTSSNPYRFSAPPLTTAPVSDPVAGKTNQCDCSLG